MSGVLVGLRAVAAHTQVELLHHVGQLRRSLGVTDGDGRVIRARLAILDDVLVVVLAGRELRRQHILVYSLVHPGLAKLSVVFVLFYASVPCLVRVVAVLDSVALEGRADFGVS